MFKRISEWFGPGVGYRFSRPKSKPTITICTIEGRPGCPKSEMSPEAYARAIQRLRDAGIKVPETRQIASSTPQQIELDRLRALAQPHYVDGVRECVLQYGPHEYHGIDCASVQQWDAASAAHRLQRQIEEEENGYISR